MTVHVLHAGDGYTYLTRQVAAGDHARLRGDTLTDYYLAEGNPPGRWVGAGRAAMGVDDVVSEPQMKALFGQGLHPDADARIAGAIARGISSEDAESAARLGRRFPVLDQSGQVWRVRVDAAYADFTAAQGRRPERGPERDLIRWTVATDLFRETNGRAPADDAEVKAFIAEVAKPPRQPVAGVDLVFTPVKSVSVLWALADEPTRRQVEAGHEAAWRRAFAFIEREAALTRTGKAGIAQVNTNGLVAAAFDHPDSRTGDPNLHTHVAVSAKVQGQDGLWRALDMRVLHAMAVAASETYNTAIEDELRERLGVQFVDRDGGRDKRPVREIDGIPAQLLTAFSSRRADIQTGYDDALARYRQTHGHDAPRTVQYRLAQEATLAHRPDKAAPRSWATARTMWLAQAREVLARGPFGRGGDLPALIARVTGRGIRAVVLDDAARDALAVQAVAAVAESRSTWTRWHLHAEVQRLTRRVHLPPTGRDDLVTDITDRAINRLCLLLEAPELDPVPDGLRRSDGDSVYAVHGAARYTSEPLILAVEDQLVAALGEHTITGTPDPILTAAAAALEASTGLTLDEGQRNLARAFVCDDRRLVIGIGPAGTGKTTAMRLAAQALQADGRRLVAVAPSARAAAVLAVEIDSPATTLAKLLHAANSEGSVGRSGTLTLGAGDVVLVDEAGMASTPALGRLLDLARASGAVVRLLGDPKQLSSVGAGGALRLLAQHGEPAQLDRIHRFLDPAEADATLGLRGGRVAALGFYEAKGRLTDGSRAGMLDDIYDAWHADTTAGLVGVMLSASGVEAAALSARAQHERVLAGDVTADGVALHDGAIAGVGDVVVTRLNRRTLPVLAGRDFVKNGDLWRVTAVRSDGALGVTHLGHGGSTVLPPAYAAAHVELGYATTVHRAQGLTVDTAHVLVDKAMTREALYVAMSRGRTSNHAYIVTDETVEVDLHHQPPPTAAATDVLVGVLSREGAERSATETIRQSLAAAESLATIVPRYLHALGRVVATPELDAAVRAGLRDAGGPALERRTADGHGWGRLLLACAAEKRPREAVAVAVRTELLDLVEPDHVAAVLARRVARLGAEDSDQSAADRMPFRPPWLDPPPTRQVTGPVAAWAVRQDEQIVSRVRDLVDAVAVDPPGWAATMAPRPSHGPHRDRWERDVAVVAAYRDQHGIRDDVTHLAARHGQDPSPGTRAAMAAAWDRLNAPAPPPPEAPVTSANDRIRALATRAASTPTMGTDPSIQRARRRPEDERPAPRHTPTGIHR